MVRSHASALPFIESLLTLLDDEAVSWHVARALGALFTDDGILTKRNGAVLKVGRATLRNAVGSLTLTISFSMFRNTSL